MYIQQQRFDVVESGTCFRSKHFEATAYLKISLELTYAIVVFFAIVVFYYLILGTNRIHTQVLNIYIYILIRIVLCVTR